MQKTALFEEKEILTMKFGARFFLFIGCYERFKMLKYKYYSKYTRGVPFLVIQESAEMYLETILVLSRRIGQVRSIDVVNEMGFSKPTVSEQMKKFRENGYIEMDGDGFIFLTEKGREIAERIYERHIVLTKLLMAIGVDEKSAHHDACKIEHGISDESFECIKAHYYNYTEGNK